MAYDRELDARVAAEVSAWNAVRKAMFGGTCYLLDGTMMCGVWRDRLIVRLGAAQADSALRERGAAPFDITGRPMKGWVMVDESGLGGDRLRSWVARAHAFVSALPAK